MSRIIEVVEYNAGWPSAFERELEALSAVFGDSLLASHHVGSTAVEGLAAKPVIDILLVLRETTTIERFSPAMEHLGYRVRGECLDAVIPGTPGRFYFSKDLDGIRTHHVHACAEGHAQIGDLLAFRDYLRAHPIRAAEYGALKRGLARGHHSDNLGYMRGKHVLVLALLDEAQEWAASSPNSRGPLTQVE